MKALGGTFACWASDHRRDRLVNLSLVQSVIGSAQADPPPMKRLLNSLRRALTLPLPVLKGQTVGSALSWILPLGLYWIVIGLRLPESVGRPFSDSSSLLFVLVLGSYYLAFRPRAAVSLPLGLALTMLLFGLTVSYLWTSGLTDNGIIGGLLPYKDAKNYYFGASQILEGLPLRSGINAIRRPLFPGLLASLLLLDGGSLKLAVAILAQMAGLGMFTAARALRASFGPAAAALYASLLYFYVQPKLGYIVSEVPGFTLGCLAFSILWVAAPTRSWKMIGLGLAALMAALSTRAGAFLVFPFMALWCGWIFRGSRRYSVTAALVSAGGILLLYLLLNTAFSRLLDIELTDQWSNFAYAMYGQVHGGTGWHSAIDDLNTIQGSVVAAAAWRYFLAHPLSLLIGIAKAYRDFLLPGDVMIFPLGSPREPAWASVPLWAGTILLLARGLDPRPERLSPDARLVAARVLCRRRALGSIPASHGWWPALSRQHRRTAFCVAGGRTGDWRRLAGIASG